MSKESFSCSDKDIDPVDIKWINPVQRIAETLERIELILRIQDRRRNVEKEQNTIDMLIEETAKSLLAWAQTDAIDADFNNGVDALVKLLQARASGVT